MARESVRPAKPPGYDVGPPASVSFDRSLADPDARRIALLQAKLEAIDAQQLAGEVLPLHLQDRPASPDRTCCADCMPASTLSQPQFPICSSHCDGRELVLG
jgi:hypothetical protein